MSDADLRLRSKSETSSSMTDPAPQHVGLPRTESELLNLLEALQGQIPGAAVAARALRHQPAGRKQIDDTQALAEVRRLVESTAMSASAACLRVAKSIAGHNAKPESIAKRLLGKLNGEP